MTGCGGVRWRWRGAVDSGGSLCAGAQLSTRNCGELFAELLARLGRPQAGVTQVRVCTVRVMQRQCTARRPASANAALRCGHTTTRAEPCRLSLSLRRRRLATCSPSRCAVCACDLTAEIFSRRRRLCADTRFPAAAFRRNCSIKLRLTLVRYSTPTAARRVRLRRSLTRSWRTCLAPAPLRVRHR